MSDGLLVYDGVTYRLPAEALADLLARGVIVPDRQDGGQYALAPEHLIDEIEALSTVLERRSGEEARGEVEDLGKRRMLAVRFMHRDGQGGR
jgi:hypothetical protein